MESLTVKNTQTSGPQNEHITGCLGGGLRSPGVSNDYWVWSNVGLLYSQARLVGTLGITDT